MVGPTITHLLSVGDGDKSEVWKRFEKSESDVKDYLNILLEWLGKQPHLPKDIDLLRLERFLVRNKFRVEQTKTKLDKYYTLRGLHSEFTRIPRINSELYQNHIKSFYYVPLPKLTKNKERLYFYTFSEDCDSWNMTFMFQYMYLMMEFSLSHDYCLGDRFICDMSGLSLTHLKKIEISALSKGVDLLQDAFSGRILGMHMFNVNSTIEMLINLLKLALKEELMKKFKVHGDLDSLYDVIERDCLPIDFGGNQKPYKELHENWQEVIKSKMDYLEELSKQTSNESLRIENCQANELFGVEGSFKKLNLD